MKYPHIRQHDEKDCGAACLSMICEYYGRKLPITYFRELIKVDNFGSNIYGIVSGAKELGFDTEALEGNVDELFDGINNAEIPFPFIARIINDEMYEHFIVVYAIKYDSVYIGDPSKLHITKMPIDLFLSQWQEQIIIFSPNSSFRKENKRRGTLGKFFSLFFIQKKLLAVVFVVSLIISGIGLFSASIFEYIIDDVVTIGDINDELDSSGYITYDEHDHEHDSSHENEEIHKLSIIDKISNTLSIVFQNLETVCISIIILYLIRAALQALRGYMLAVLARNFDIPLSLGYYNHLVDLPANFFGTRKTGELISRFSDASNIRDAISTATLSIMLDTLMAFFVGIYLIVMNYKLFLITAVVMIIYAAIMLLFRKPIKTVNQNVMEGNAQVTAYLKESVDGIETVKAYQYENCAKKKTESIFRKLVNQIVHGTVVYNLQEVLVSVVESIGMVALLWIGAYLCLDGIITIGTLITFYFILGYFLDPVQNLIELQPTLQTAIVAAERLNDVLDVKIEDNTKTSIGNLFGDIVLEKVNFRYGTRNLVLKNISMRVKKGTKIALVGESGSGKTTLVKLLMSFYPVESGIIQINGKKISEYSPKSIRERIAYISQDVFLFSDTVYNNLRMGDETITDDEIERMCTLCFADQFIQELPFGYNTMLEENGNNLSGGQKQRIAIARALLRNPDILIMDEATSNLDVVTEESIRKIINELSDEMTVIIIAHRLKTIRTCDCIYVLENGEIVEKGNHNELIRRKGLYANYWNSQS